MLCKCFFPHPVSLLCCSSSPELLLLQQLLKPSRRHSSNNGEIVENKVPPLPSTLVGILSSQAHPSQVSPSPWIFFKFSLLPSIFIWSSLCTHLELKQLGFEFQSCLYLSYTHHLFLREATKFAVLVCNGYLSWPWWAGEHLLDVRTCPER